MRRILLVWFAAASGCLLGADTGVILPTGHEGPDTHVLSVETIDANVLIDNGHATVHLKEVFANHTSNVLEGTYILALPDGATVSDFAVWDGLTRIPGVILERKRASELYQEIRAQAIDPGLLESSEVSESNAPGEARHSTEFAVKIVPIPAYGYKRIEAAYRQNVKLAQLGSNFVLPLKSSSPIIAGHLNLHVELRSAQAIEHFEEVGQHYRLKVQQQSPNRVLADFAGDNVALSDDWQLRYNVANTEAPSVIAYRDVSQSSPGYFEAAALLQQSPGGTEAEGATRNIVVLFDTSLSMQWEKLERSFQALEAALRSLRLKDTFNVIVFNSGAASFAPEPKQASPEAIAQALDWVRAGALRGGTNLEQAFRAGFAQCRANSYLVLLSDGEMTQGTVTPSKLNVAMNRSWTELAAERRPHVYALAIGDDANVAFLRRLTEHGGAFEQVNSSEPLAFKLNAFIHSIGATPLTPIALKTEPQTGMLNVYRLGDDRYPGGRASWVGEYEKPGTVQFTISSGVGAAARKQAATATLPENNTEHEYLPATWARARVDALLEKIDRDGEDKLTIDEIIRLSRQYHFVTPYTSFLAAPRALLRPRLIRPGDPLLRVKTDSSIASVIALFPFGLSKPLRYIGREDIWETRFVAPSDMTDGSYAVRLLLRDRNGHVYQEHKTFLISSHAPVVRVNLSSTRVHPGATLTLSVQASSTTRTITANLWGSPPLALHWNESDRANTGQLQIGPGLPPGRYTIHVSAEDIAHNVSHQEVPLEVVP